MSHSSYQGDDCIVPLASVSERSIASHFCEKKSNTEFDCDVSAHSTISNSYPHNTLGKRRTIGSSKTLHSYFISVETNKRLVYSINNTSLMLLLILFSGFFLRRQAKNGR